MRHTKQKERILQAVRTIPNHPTAEMVYDLLKPTNPRLSLATVYRNLNLFASQGKLLKLDIPSEPARYDANVHPHAHGVCDVCGMLMDIQIERYGDFLVDLKKYIERREDFRISDITMQIRGVCAACRAAAESAAAGTAGNAAAEVTEEAEEELKAANG
ncbi:MAG: transcriptional repressor [Bacillota bacterium]|nr:transcriptional repressor [Bacillota bacterium]